MGTFRLTTISNPHYKLPNITEGVFKSQYGPLAAGDQLVEEFMSETQQAASTAPQAFRMDSLLQVMWSTFPQLSLLLLRRGKFLYFQVGSRV